MKIKRVTVKKNERGLLLRNGDFERVLQPGTHWLFDGIDHLRVETFALEQPAFTHGLADYLMAKEPEVVAAEFVRVELTETQVGLRSENGALVEVLAPATRRLYWKGQVDVRCRGDRHRRVGRSAGRRGGASRANADAPARGGRPGRRAAGAGARTRRRHPVDRRQGRAAAGAGFVRVLEVQPQRRGGSRGPAAAGGRSDGPGHPDPRQGRPAAEPVGHLALCGCAEGLHATGQARGAPVPRAAVRPAGGRGHAHARRAAGEQDGDRRGRDRPRAQPSSRPMASSWTAWA